MSTAILIGVGVAGAGKSLSSSRPNSTIHTNYASIALAGRIGLQTLKKYRALPGGGGSFGKQFYKGGFEQKMNRREAVLILQLRYALCERGGG